MAAAANGMNVGDPIFVDHNGYPRELVDEKFISKDDFHVLEMKVQQLENNLQHSQLENENKSLQERLLSIRDLGKWGITTIIALAALIINLLK